MLANFPAVVCRLHNAAGGATVHPDRGDLAGHQGYAVAVYPDRSQLVAGAILDEPVVAAYVERNGDALATGSVAVGTWYDGSVTWLDLSAVVPNKRLAIRLGRQHNQIAVWDLRHAVEVPTGGTGAAA